MKPPFEWDQYSDQPKVILDKAYKRRVRARYWLDYLKMAGVSAITLPVAMAHMALMSKRSAPKSLRDLLGIGVSLDRGPRQFDLIDELGIQHVLIRVPLWDLEKLRAYQAFGQEFRNRGKTVLINILQDREHIENIGLLTNDLYKIFDSFAPMSHEFQIGNAINRLKWGFFAPEEYLKFYQIAHQIRNQHFPRLELLGPSVIDFEYHYTARALFNSYGLEFDRLSALLYVDRMGAPNNKQYGVFNTDRKMRMLSSLTHLSQKVKHKSIYITEVNWPLKGTAPWAPTSEKECVSAEEYAQYMQAYITLALNSECIDRIYWHQLIAPGYGLINDSTDEASKKAFYMTRKLLNPDR